MARVRNFDSGILKRSIGSRNWRSRFTPGTVKDRLLNLEQDEVNRCKGLRLQMAQQIFRFQKLFRPKKIRLIARTISLMKLINHTVIEPPFDDRTIMDFV
ncbi:MAG: hypothetical protein AB1757_16285 [Acidobacteriota bacterium]